MQNSVKPLETWGISTIVGKEEGGRAEVIGLVQLLSIMERTGFDPSCKLIFLLPSAPLPFSSLLLSLIFFLMTWSYVAQASLELICS